MRAIDFLTMPSGAALLPVIDAIAKATIVFAAAGLLSVVLRRASAAARHLIWTLALLSALILPVFSFALPKWEVGLVKVAGSQLSSSYQLPAASSQRPAPRLKSDAASVGIPARQPATDEQTATRDPRPAALPR